MARPKRPQFDCPECTDNRWVWDSTYDRWQCYTCQLYGRPTPTPPTHDESDIEEWNNSVLEEYEHAMEARNIAVEELFTAESNKKSPIVAKAKLNRADKELEGLKKKVEIGTLVTELKTYSEHGDVYFSMPDSKIKVRFKW